MFKQAKKQQSTKSDQATERIVTVGLASNSYCDNRVSTSKYTWFSFFPIAILEQFRRRANVFFLCMVVVLAIGDYVPYFSSAYTPWTLLGPLSIVIAVSLAQEGFTDVQRHRSDYVSNTHVCTRVTRTDEQENQAQLPPDVEEQAPKATFEDVQRKEFKVGQLVFLRNRDMIPCDVVLLASSGELGGAYVETSGIDGETNLKLRSSAKPKEQPSQIFGESSRSILLSNSFNILDAQTRNQHFFLGDSLQKSVNNIAYTKTDTSPEWQADDKNSFKSNSERNILLNDRSINGQRLDSPIPSPEVPSSPLTTSPKMPSTTIELDKSSLVPITPPFTPPRDTPSSPITPHLQANSMSNLPQQQGESTSRLETPERLHCSSFDVLDVIHPPRRRQVSSPEKCSLRNSIMPLKPPKPSTETLDDALDRISKMSGWTNAPMATLTVEPPNASVHTFNGKLVLNSDTVLPLNAEHLLLRGAVLRNTDWAIGVAVYTGHDTKIVQNSNPAPSKLSRLDELVNRIVTIMIILMFTLVFALSVGSQVSSYLYFDLAWYLGYNIQATLHWPYLTDLPPPDWQDQAPNFLQLLVFFTTLLGSFVPLTIYVAIEMTTRLLMLYIMWDINMYHEPSDTPANARSTTVTDLGQVKYIFSDKTGTLTQNVMRFTRCSVDGMLFGAPIPTSRPDDNDKDQIDESPPFHPLSALLAGAGLPDKRHGYLTWNAEMFLRVMCLCHTVVVEKDTIEGENEMVYPPDSKNADGAPFGMSYQAESPDEGALVSAASLEYGFQLVARDASGVEIACSSPSLLSDESVVNSLKRHKVTCRELANQTISSTWNHTLSPIRQSKRREKWQILAINKFDSTRKRMSVLVRSPDELGGLLMLLCKGADSAMLEVCQTKDQDEDDSLLEIQAHLGQFASEGLRTLVLGVRFLSESFGRNWLKRHEQAAASISNRDAKLTEVALEIEQEVHLVGVTAIEDKLQDGVPSTIFRLAQAGIKLWVLTGDKRETAIEIGYSTKVLTSQMTLLQIQAEGATTTVAREFLRLVKLGLLSQYQSSALKSVKDDWCTEFIGKCRVMICALLCLPCTTVALACSSCKRGNHESEPEEDRAVLVSADRRRQVRERAELIVKKSAATHTQVDETSPFERARRAEESLREHRASRGLSPSDLRSMALATYTRPEDLLSMRSFVIDDTTGEAFDPSRRTVWERWFAVDRDVRHGRLQRHESKIPGATDSKHNAPNDTVSRALIIDGAALTHILHDSLLSQMLFAVASQCDAVIACRVSPKQKALLVRTVRRNVNPEPITLAIGDGANDVGMIQEAHVGIGISGLEGQQAVNSSDFSIAQFRFLEDLLLVHGRWSFTRLARMVLFTFYKNAILAGLIIMYAGNNLFSGTPLFDQWLVGMFNFVTQIPILFVGFFDRDIDREYVKRNPQLYAAGPDSEDMSIRKVLRWLSLTMVHMFIIYFVTMRLISPYGSMTPAWSGLMWNKSGDWPGNGEGDYKTFGTAIFSVMVFATAYKAIYETKSIILGSSACVKSSTSADGLWSRIPWTWVGFVVGQVLFYFWAVYMYQITAQNTMVDSFLSFIGVATATFSYQADVWLAIFLVPILTQALDVVVKMFGNMYFPTQTQIHAEISTLQQTTN